VQRVEEAPEPRIAHERGPGRRELSPLLSLGAYYLAALSLSEGLIDGGASRQTPLEPWRDGLPEPMRSQMLNAILEALVSAPEELAWTVPALDLVARLPVPAASALAEPDGGELRHPLELAGVIRSAAAERGLSLELWNEVLASRDAQRFLEDVLRGREAAQRAVARSLWETLIASPDTDARQFDVSGELRALLWQHAPSATLETFVFEAPGPVAFDALLEHQWQELCGACIVRRTFPKAADFFRGVPSAELAKVVQAGVVPQVPELARIAWERVPGDLAELISQKLPEAGVELGPLLENVPERHLVTLVAEFRKPERLARLTTESLRSLSRLLHRRVAERAQGFRAAYELLDEVEERLAAALPLH
jgi:hypothetical protein